MREREPGPRATPLSLAHSLYRPRLLSKRAPPSVAHFAVIP